MIRVFLATVGAALVLAVLPAYAAHTTTVLKLSTATGPTMKFTKTSLRAPAGIVKIVLTNKSTMPHNVAIKGNGVRVTGKIVAKGGVSVAKARLKAGKYTFYCSVPGHEAAGMKGTLTVTKS